MKLLINIIFLFAFWSCLSFAEWAEIKGPEIATVSRIGMAEEMLLSVAMDWELYSLNTASQSWRNIIIPEEIEYISKIGGVDNSVFLITQRGLFYSEDSGQTWKKELFNDKDIIGLNALSVYKNDMYVASSNRLYKYYSGVEPYDVICDSLPNPVMDYFSVSDMAIIATSSATSDYPKGGSCVWASYDGGKTFTDITTDDIEYKYLSQSVIWGDTVFVTSQAGMYKSHIKNIKWEKFYGPTEECFWRMTKTENEIFAILPSGYLAFSENGGQSWEIKVSQGLNPTDYILRDLVVVDDVVYCNTDRGVLRTPDKGLHWELVNKGFNSIDVLNIETTETECFISGMRAGLYGKKLSESGWTHYPKQKKQEAYATICIDEDRIYTGRQEHGYLEYSDDRGETWETLSPDLPRAHYYVLEPHGDYMFTSTTFLHYGFFRVKKDGSAVDTLVLDMPGDTISRNLFIDDFDSDDEMMLASSPFGFGLYKSDSEGLDWSPVEVDSTETGFYSVAIEDGVCFAGSATGKLYASYDKGENWDLLFESPVDTSYINRIRVKDGFVYFAVQRPYPLEYTEECGLYLYHLETGKSGYVNVGGRRLWRRWIRDMEFFGDSLIVATPGMMYKSDLDFLKTVSVEDVESPSNYLYVSKVYPLPAREEVKAEIYWDKKLDILTSDFDIYDFDGSRICGRERLKIEKNSDWSGVVTWDASGVPPGIYFLYIRHGDKSKAVKMLVE